MILEWNGYLIPIELVVSVKMMGRTIWIKCLCAELWWNFDHFPASKHSHFQDRCFKELLVDSVRVHDSSVKTLKIEKGYWRCSAAVTGSRWCCECSTRRHFVCERKKETTSPLQPEEYIDDCTWLISILWMYIIDCNPFSLRFGSLFAYNSPALKSPVHIYDLTCRITSYFGQSKEVVNSVRMRKHERKLKVRKHERKYGGMRLISEGRVANTPKRTMMIMLLIDGTTKSLPKTKNKRHTMDMTTNSHWSFAKYPKIRSFFLFTFINFFDLYFVSSIWSFNAFASFAFVQDWETCSLFSHSFSPASASFAFVQDWETCPLFSHSFSRTYVSCRKSTNAVSSYVRLLPIR